MTAFITTDEFGLYMRRDMTGDALASLVCELACSVIREEVELSLDGVEDDVVVVIGHGSPVLLLPEIPAVSVSEVKVLGRTSASDRVIDAASYRLQPDGTLAYRFASVAGTLTWARGAEYQVTYSHGYNTPDTADTTYPELPPLLRLLAITVAARIYDQGIVSQETIGGYQTIFSAPSSAALTPHERALLGRLFPGRK